MSTWSDMTYGTGGSAGNFQSGTSSVPRNVDLGINTLAIVRAVDDIKKCTNQFTNSDTYDLTRNIIIDKLGKGWISSVGKDRIVDIATNITDLVNGVAKAVEDIVNSIEESAKTISQQITPIEGVYSPRGCDFAPFTVDSSWATSSDSNGNSYIVVEYLEEARDYFKKNYTQQFEECLNSISTAAKNTGLYDKDNSLMDLINTNVENLSKLAKEKITEVVNDIETSINDQSETTLAAKSRGKSLLEGGSVNSGTWHNTNTWANHKNPYQM